MRRKIFLTLIVIALCLPQLASAQLGRWDSESDSKLEEGIREGSYRPYIEMNYGLVQPGHQDLDQAFAALGLAEIKFGFGSLEREKSGVNFLDERYVFGSYIAEDIGSGTPDEADIIGKFGRFGVGNRMGYGWGEKALKFSMYNQNSINWTNVDAVNYEVLTPESQEVFDRYGDVLRFGQLFEAGVKLNLTRSLSFTAGVEGAVIFPRTVFWEWAGSAALYSAIQGGFQFFTGKITESSPVLGPILNFVLKSAVSAGYYYVSRDDMNWPFTSETPMTMESAKLGAAIAF